MLYKTNPLKSIGYLLICVKFSLTQSYFPNFCKDPKTGTIRSSFRNSAKDLVAPDSAEQYPIYLAFCHDQTELLQAAAGW